MKLQLLLLLAVTVLVSTATVNYGGTHPQPGDVLSTWNVTTYPSEAGYPQRTTHTAKDMDGNPLLIYVGAHFVVAYHPSNNTPVWTYYLGGSPDGASILDEKTNLLIFTTQNWANPKPGLNGLIAIDSRNGTIVWQLMMDLKSFYWKPQLQIVELNSPNNPRRVLFALGGMGITTIDLQTGCHVSYYGSLYSIGFCVVDQVNLLVGVEASSFTKGGLSFNVYDLGVSESTNSLLYGIFNVKDVNTTWDTMKPVVHCSAAADGGDSTTPYKLHLFVGGNKQSTSGDVFTTVTLHNYLLEKQTYSLVNSTTLQQEGYIAATNLEATRPFSSSAVIQNPVSGANNFYINTVSQMRSSSTSARGELFAVDVPTNAVAKTVSTPSPMQPVLFAQTTTPQLSCAITYSTIENDAIVNYLRVVNNMQSSTIKNGGGGGSSSFTVAIPAVPNWNQQYLSFPAVVGNTVATVVEDQVIESPDRKGKVFFTFFEL